MSPIAKQIEGYPFEVALPKNLGVYGVVLADQIKSLDWRARKAESICRVLFMVAYLCTFNFFLPHRDKKKLLSRQFCRL